MQVTGELFEAEYRRDYGVHVFEMHDGQPVAVVSSDDWDEARQALRSDDIPEDSTVVTPELMTAPYDMEDVPGRLGEVFRRIIDVQSFSTARPSVTYVLGSPATDSAPTNDPEAVHDPRPFNSLVVIKDGLRVAQINKWALASGVEATVFKRADAPAPLVSSTLAALVCRDLVAASCQAMNREMVGHERLYEYVNPAATKLVISACWAVTQATPEQWARIGSSKEEFYAMFLNMYIKDMFKTHPHLQDIVMADMLAPDSGTDGPFNAHFQRIIKD